MPSCPVWRNHPGLTVYNGGSGIARKTLLAKHRRHGFGILAGERVMIGLTFRRDTVTGHGLDLQHFRDNFGRYWPRRDGRGQ